MYNLRVNADLVDTVGLVALIGYNDFCLDHPSVGMQPLHRVENPSALHVTPASCCSKDAQKAF